MKEFSLPKEQIILGGLLGDSSFNLKRKTIAFSQCEKQLEYVQWKYSFFDTKAEIHSVYNARDGKNYLRYYKRNKSIDLATNQCVFNRKDLLKLVEYIKEQYGIVIEV